MLNKILLFGNSGSGKSTLATSLSSDKKASKHSSAHLDLDTIAWLASTPPERMPIEQSRKRIIDFTADKSNWVIEGCYADLLEIASPLATEIIFLNLPIELCIENAKNRPWEPHKYKTKQAQDENLTMLIEWITDYKKRDNEFSYQAHLQFYTSFKGKKSMIERNADR